MKKETIELVKKMIEDGNLSQEIAEKYCPELAESEPEDERIRKAIIHLVNKSQEYGGYALHKDEADKMIAWLEKQSTPQVRTGLEWVNTIDDACDKRYLEEYAHGEYCHEQSFKWGFQEGVDWLEKQGEQKSVDFEFITDILDWLKSLRPQNKWKPSDTEINILQGVIDGSFKPENTKVTLTNILEQLKKLREE